ncbi:cardiolipin synthase [Pigmentiphaga kullae]|uniref:Cardiolipin synthase n=1 Tax=Pigmentiphaga kullae TaxID=151784 RepID=A0A4Q7NEV2_9BURK|nr:cardiolipin synthase [Pigmentiphaga kullae]RZS81672.1 cardiolipin synthase [Pigmentiphaga kullae]
MAHADLHHHLINAWSVGWALYIASVTVWIVLQKRPPLSTVLWILVLALLPYVGYAVYYFFGPQRLKRRRLKRLRSRLLISSQTERALLREHDHDTPLPVARMAALARSTSDIPLSSATDVQLLVGGGQTYGAFMEAITEARHHVHLEFYIFKPDRIGTAMRDLLIEKARQGVTVRLLVDALGSERLGRRFLAPLREAGAQVGFFHNVRIGRRWRPVTNYRNHRKILICDGRTGFTGGLNVTDDEDERVRPDAYHDVHLRVEGGAVRWLQMVFLEDWAYTTGQRTDDCELDALLPEVPGGPHQLQILTSGPDDPRQSIHRTLVAAINAATERVWLTTAYFVPSEAALMSLTSAAHKGVDVRLLVPRRSDSLVVTAASRSYFDELLEAGVKVWEYRDRMLHSKTLLVDDTYSFIGTANFDNRSFELNFEVTALVYGEDMARQLGRQFELDLRHAARVPKDRQSPFVRRLFDASARLFSPML